MIFLSAGIQGNCSDKIGFLTKPLGCVNPDTQGLDAITQVIVNLIQIGLELAGTLAVIFIIYGGIQYITSAGSPQGVTAAKTTLVNAIVGLVFVVLAYTIVAYVAGIFG